jgi:hypothetical protein
VSDSGRRLEAGGKRVACAVAIGSRQQVGGDALEMLLVDPLEALGVLRSHTG